MIRRIGRMIDGLNQYNLDVTQMTLKVKVGKRLAVVAKAIPPDKIIAKKIVRKRMPSLHLGQCPLVRARAS